jgi:hypothetical protein
VAKSSGATAIIEKRSISTSRMASAEQAQFSKMEQEIPRESCRKK